MRLACPAQLLRWSSKQLWPVYIRWLRAGRYMYARPQLLRTPWVQCRTTAHEQTEYTTGGLWPVACVSGGSSWSRELLLLMNHEMRLASTKPAAHRGGTIRTIKLRAGGPGFITSATARRVRSPDGSAPPTRSGSGQLYKTGGGGGRPGGRLRPRIWTLLPCAAAGCLVRSSAGGAVLAPLAGLCLQRWAWDRSASRAAAVPPAPSAFGLPFPPRWTDGPAVWSRPVNGMPPLPGEKSVSSWSRFHHFTCLILTPRWSITVGTDVGIYTCA